VSPKHAGKGGAYLLVLRLDAAEDIKVGALGSLYFPKGTYVYAGSALTSLESRVARHFSMEKRMHWHIDHLRAKARPVEALVLRSQADLECMINEMVGRMEGARPFAPGFGSSDCCCSTHLHILDRNCLPRLEGFFPERLRPEKLPR
jgi:sugar fermentation stimulation protein A